MVRRLAGDRRQRLHEGVKVGDVGRLHARIGRIGKSRIEMLAGRRHAAQHGVGEILDRPGADAVVRIGGDVGRHEGAERRLQLEAAGQFKLRVALRFRARVAGRAAAGLENPLAARGVARARARRLVAASSRCGVVRNQNAAAPTAAKDERGDGEFLAASRHRRRSALLDAVGLVAAAAIRRRSRRTAPSSASTSWPVRRPRQRRIGLVLVDRPP